MSSLEQLKKAIDHAWAPLRGDTLSFPPAPCTWLCQRKDIRRFHLSCLTCPTRRYYLTKRGKEKFTRYKNLVYFMESVTGRGFILPKRYKTYGLVFPLRDDGTMNWVKTGIIKVLLTIAERIAEF